MGINPINFRHNVSNNKVFNEKKNNNSIAEIEFNIITDTLRNKTYQNNVNFRLKNLRQSLNS